MTAIITCLISGEYTLYDQSSNKTFVAKARGIFRNQKTSPKVGDIVEYTSGNPYATIVKILPRHSDFVRPPIANIDQAFIVTSVKEPSLNLNLLDRMISVFEFQNILPILVFSKMDLLNDNEKEEVFKKMDYYQTIGYPIIKTTTIDPLTIDKIKPYLKDKTSVITGQSGVGKSSIINLIDETIKMDTAEISKALNRGKHTTRYTKLFFVENGWLADTPGFGMVEFFDMDEVSLSHSFIEFFHFSESCKYSGCLHHNEPSCNVKRKLEEGLILKSRYENYQQFMNEIKSRRKW